MQFNVFIHVVCCDQTSTLPWGNWSEPGGRGEGGAKPRTTPPRGNREHWAPDTFKKRHLFGVCCVPGTLCQKLAFHPCNSLFFSFSRGSGGTLWPSDLPKTAELVGGRAGWDPSVSGFSSVSTPQIPPLASRELPPQVWGLLSLTIVVRPGDSGTD